MYTTPGNSLVAACFLKWPIMFPLAMAGAAGFAYSGLCGDVPVVVPPTPVAVVYKAPDPAPAPYVAPFVAPEPPKAVEPPAPQPAPVPPKKKVKG